MKRKDSTANKIERILNLSKRTFSFITATFPDAFRLFRSPKEGVRSVYGVSLYRNAGYLRKVGGQQSAVNSQPTQQSKLTKPPQLT